MKTRLNEMSPRSHSDGRQCQASGERTGPDPEPNGPLGGRPHCQPREERGALKHDIMPRS